MLRLLLWRLGFEFWNLVAAIISVDKWGLFSRLNPPINYFAFGANLDPAVLARRRMRVRTTQFGRIFYRMHFAATNVCVLRCLEGRYAFRCLID